MKKFTLYVGLNDKDTKIQKISTLEAYKMVNNLLLNTVEGATISESDGIYKHENGEIVIEKTLRIELIYTDMETVKKIIEILKSLLNQEAILLQVQEIENMFL